MESSMEYNGHHKNGKEGAAGTLGLEERLESDIENLEDPGEHPGFEVIDQVESEEEETVHGEKDEVGSQKRHIGVGKRSAEPCDSSSEDDDFKNTEQAAVLEKFGSKNSIRKWQEPIDSVGGETQAVGNRSSEETAENLEDEEEDPGEDHEFEIIDQVESEEEGGEKETDDGASDKKGQQDRQDGAAERDQDGADGPDDYSSSSDDFDDSELHAMLEKGIDRNSIKKKEEPTEGKPIIKMKTVLKEIETDPFDILPEGWICVTHHCGMPVYLHRESRVCSMARPYALGSASARTHSIPISAIPCLMYRKQLDKITQNGNGIPQPDEPSAPGAAADSGSPGAKLVCQASQDSSATGGLDPSSGPPSSYSSVPQDSGQRALLVMEESSCQGGAHEATRPNEVLHTGKEDFTLIRHESVELGNIAVDSTSGQGVKPLPETKCHTDMEWADSSVCPYKATSGKLPTEESCVTKTLLESQQLKESKSQEVSAESPEEGEIVEESSSSEKDCLQSGIPQLEQVPTKSPIVSEKRRLCEDIDYNKQRDKAMQENPATNDAHIVREEEGQGSQDQSQLVTSSTNSLASLKRKLESLRSKRGGKRSRLEHGSTGLVSWPVENNVAVSSLKYGHTSMATASANSNETLRANAAAIKIKSAEDRARESFLDSSAVQNYCSKLFQFKVIEVKKYSTWKERRKHLEYKNKRNRPELPSSTKLITCPMPTGRKIEANPKREFVLNPTGKSFLCILHEYMQRTLKIQPLYVFKELENSKTPYGATVTINNIEYGTGYASSKKIAKQEAAKETLKILMPDLFNKMSDQEIKRSISDVSFFDNVKVTDSRINELGTKVGQPSPFEILKECLRRNFGMGNTECEISTKPLKNQKCEYSIKVGKHSASVVAKNKRDGKQLASQAILAKLHPHVPSWGSLLRLYRTSVEKPILKPEEINDIKGHAPNLTVLASLREEMRKLHRQKEAIQVKGKIIISSRDLPNKTIGVDL